MRPTTWLSDPVAFFQSDSMLYVYDFQTGRVVIELTPGWRRQRAKIRRTLADRLEVQT